jgi:hypothetical protein
MGCLLSPNITAYVTRVYPRIKVCYTVWLSVQRWLTCLFQQVIESHPGLFKLDKKVLTSPDTKAEATSLIKNILTENRSTIKTRVSFPPQSSACAYLICFSSSLALL